MMMKTAMIMVHLWISNQSHLVRPSKPKCLRHLLSRFLSFGVFLIRWQNSGPFLSVKNLNPREFVPVHFGSSYFVEQVHLLIDEEQDEMLGRQHEIERHPNFVKIEFFVAVAVVVVSVVVAAAARQAAEES